MNLQIEPRIGEPLLLGKNPDGVYDYLFCNNFSVTNLYISRIISPTGSLAFNVSGIDQWTIDNLGNFLPQNTLPIGDGPDVGSYTNPTGQIYTDRLQANYVTGLSNNSNTGILQIGNAAGNEQWQITSVNCHLSPMSSHYTDIGNPFPVRNMFADVLCTGVKAGVAVDSDVTNPTSGMIRVDSTNNRLYVRVGTIWRYATLT